MQLLHLQGEFCHSQKCILKHAEQYVTVDMKESRQIDGLLCFFFFCQQAKREYDAAVEASYVVSELIAKCEIHLLKDNL